MISETQIELIDLGIFSVIQSDCTIGLVEKSSENYILSATLDQFLESRMKKQMTDEMLWTEKVCPKDSAECWKPKITV